MYPGPDLMSDRERSARGAVWTRAWAMINLLFVCMCVCMRREEKRTRKPAGNLWFESKFKCITGRTAMIRQKLEAQNHELKFTSYTNNYTNNFS